MARNDQEEPERRLWKDGVDATVVAFIADRVTNVWPDFNRAGFVQAATEPLETMELKARVHHIIAALRSYLPPAYPAALEVLLLVSRGWTLDAEKANVSHFAAWPIIDFVGVHGTAPAHFDASMEALRRLTPLFSAEFAIRPFILADQERALEILRQWLTDIDEHVRRLISEGTRPRLPWGERLEAFVTDPDPVLRLLEPLRADPSEYVRRSVANNLNDIAKDHPERVVEVCGRWRAEEERPSRTRTQLVSRALRTLVKQGHPGALRVLGFDPDAAVEVSDFDLEDDRIRLGGAVQFEILLRSRSAQRERLVVDYAVHHVKKSGERTPKVFKLRTFDLDAGASATLTKAHSIRPISTRRYYAGRHAIELFVNGRSRGLVEFDLEV